jgi:hypothetical protein
MAKVSRADEGNVSGKYLYGVGDKDRPISTCTDVKKFDFLVPAMAADKSPKKFDFYQ